MKFDSNVKRAIWQLAKCYSTGNKYPPSLCLVVPPVMICIICSDCDSLNFSRTPCLFNWWSVALSLLLFWNFDLFEVLDCLPSLRLVPFEFSFNICCVETQDNGRTTSSTPKSRYSSVWSLPAKCVCRASVQGRGSHSHRNALKTFECHSTNVALSLCQFACLLNKLTSELGNFFTDAMRDSNSHEFEEIVDPFTLYLMRRSRSVLMRLMRLCRRKKRVLSLHSHGRMCHLSIVILHTQTDIWESWFCTHRQIRTLWHTHTHTHTHVLSADVHICNVKHLRIRSFSHISARVDFSLQCI